MKLKTLIMFAAALMMVASGCKKEAKPGQLESIKFKQASYTIAENYLDLNLRKELETVPANVKDTAKINYVISDEKVAVMNNSYLEPKRDGDISVTAIIQGKSATCDVKITAVPIEDFSLENFSVQTNGTAKALLTTVPYGISYERFTWKVSDESCATIDQSGVVTGLKDGTVTVTATADGKSRTCKLTVKKKIVTAVTLSETEVRFYKTGEILQLTATVEPDDASFPEVTWSSSDASCVGVDSNGKITAKKYPASNNPIVITAKADNIKATCNVTLWPEQSTSITLSKTAHTFTRLGEEFTLSISDIKPAERTIEDKFRWYTDDFNMASLTDNRSSVVGNIKSVKVKCEKTGTTKIHCLDMWSGVEAVCEVTMPEIPATEIRLEKEVFIMPEGGQTVEFRAYLTPANSTSEVYWNSSNPLVVNPVLFGKANEYGNKTTIVRLEPDQIGTTTITASVNGREAYCYVNHANTSTVSDGTNTYKTVKIGSQWWMAENLRSIKYASQSERAGSTLVKVDFDQAYVPRYSDISQEPEGCDANMTSAVRAKLGFVYNWAAALGYTFKSEVMSQDKIENRRQGICPNGWHIPTKTEYETLLKEFPTDWNKYYLISSKDGWAYPRTDAFGFSAYPAGVKATDSHVSDKVGCSTAFWTSSSYRITDDTTYGYYMGVGNSYANTYRTSKNSLMSVRCVKN